MNTYALDFESYYDGDCSIKTLGPRGYFSHPKFSAYLMSVVGTDGTRYCGHPKDFDWGLLAGGRVLSHNASFDQSLYFFGVEQNWWPSIDFAEWHCTADMTAYLGLPRSLKNAASVVLGVEADKTVRDNMKGKTWGSMSKEFQEEVIEYALKDSEYCLELWHKLSDKWPEWERNISRVNREIGQRGLPIDTDLLKKNLEQIRIELFNAEQSIPWIADGATPLSRKAFNEQCRLQGVEPPSSLASGNEEADKWFAAFQDSCPWARAVQNYRRINSFLRKLESFDHGTMADGRYYGGLMYCGANPTARFSGSGGNLNLQNLPREEMFGVNFRHMVRPKEGNKLIIADLSQIEVRTLCWLAKDWKALELIKQNDDIYEAFATLLMRFDPVNDGPLRKFPEMRHRIKSIVLGCGYGMGYAKFASFSGMDINEAERCVLLYRSQMTRVVEFWRSLDSDLRTACSLSVPLSLDLPSGRSLQYKELCRLKDPKAVGRFRYVGKIVRNGQFRDFPLWGGVLAENLSQGLARDIFSDMMLRVEEAGIPIILHVHDELVCEVPEEAAEEALATVLKIMSTPPSWIDNIPVAAEGHICDLYSK
jgi:DNA polymerase